MARAGYYRAASLSPRWTVAAACVCRSVIVALFVFAVPTYAQYLQDRDILKYNHGVSVPFGRAIYITSRDLRIDVQRGHRCKVTVLQVVDPLSQRPGNLMPTVFPCDFPPDMVQYTHYGARSPPGDSVRLQIRYDTDEETIIIPFTLQVDVAFEQLELVTRNKPLIVDKLMGISSPIGNKNLELSYNRGTSHCKLTVLSSASGLPRYGYVQDGNSFQMVDCDEFVRLGVRYRHTAETESPNRDFIPMVVELFDDDGNLLKQEYFQMMVRIRGGLENTPPQAAFHATLLLEVDQFVMTAITPEVLAAEDTETYRDNLVFNITRPLRYGEGEIVSTDDRNQAIHSFSQRDVQDLKIAYKPPSSDSNIRRMYQLELQVIDSDGLSSEPFPFMIQVNPMKTLAPVVTRNTGIRLFEGQSRPLVSAHSLEISDEDNLDDVRIRVIDGLRHGELLISGVNQKFFTPADLDAGFVMYHHDGSDTYSDNIIFRMTDGENEVEFLFPVTMYPEDDEPPVLNVNTGIEINKNDLVEINPFILSATDVDSDDSLIRFVIEPPYTEEGVFLIRKFQIPDDVQNWRYSNGVYEKPVVEFTQQDILDRTVFYSHVGPHRSDFYVDRIAFRVVDGGDIPNQSGVNEFVVKVAPVDDLPPYLHPNTPLQMEVNEFEMTEIRRKFLRYTDDDTDDRKIHYTIVEAPFDTDTNTPLSAGLLVLCDHPDRVLEDFSQAQLNHRKVCYLPPQRELGITPRIIQFIYNVEDTSGNLLPVESFTIFLKPMDNKPPVVTNAGLTVLENGFAILAPQMLDAHDSDTDVSRLTFTLTSLPKYGELQRSNQILASGDIFTREDIENGRIAYVNTGSEMEKDEFDIVVSDGIHRVPATFKITVRSIDDEAPSLINLKDGTLGVNLEVLEGQATTITSEHLTATDLDTDDLSLTFILEKAPYEGVLLIAGTQTDRFTQRDIISGTVQYRHTGGEVGIIGRNDSFTLMLTDLSDAYLLSQDKVTHIDVHIKILPLDTVPPLVTVGDFVVNEGEKETILPIYLDAEDFDTEDEDIVCTIIVQPTNGYVENQSPAKGSEKAQIGIPVSAFSIRDIRDGNINYVQSIHKNVEPREDRFTFRCSDGVNFGENFFFPISITPLNDETPELFMREFVVAEGMELKIDLPILNANDKDIPRDRLTFIITKPPKHGQIIQQRRTGKYPITNFTLADISRASTIVYEHDDSETTEDSFEILLTDGKHNVTKEIVIMVYSVDDETPRLTINNGLDIDKAGQAKLITNNELMAEDLDSFNPNLTYIIRRVGKQGLLQKIVGNEIRNLTLGSNFTQHDIDMKRIQYVHTGHEGVRDLIKFDITDGLNPLIDRYFYVTVEGIDMLYPEVINKGVELPEEGSVTLTTDLLSGSDLNSPDEHLQFSITRAPSHGHLENTDNPGMPIVTFTQLDLAGNKIRYVHTTDNEMKMDSFMFEVSDGYNPITRTFRISLSDVDNKKPVLTFETLRVKEGANKLITPFELKVIDRDTEDKKIVFTVTQIPVHGNILYNVSRIVSAFTMADLKDNLISYQHDGTETLTDSFSFTVNDGTHSDFFVFPETSFTTRWPQMMHLKIIPVDNGVPQISVNKGVSSLTQLEDGGLGFLITNKVLQTVDPDSPVSDLVYTITAIPQHGYIINTEQGNISIKEWTQGDINARHIQYRLNPSSNVTSDSYFFKITDKGGNVLENQPFHLNWAWISLEDDFFAVNETEEKYEVTLRRRGYLGETSFVTITVLNDTAKVGEDTHKRYAQQVQFNPGQTEKTWYIRLSDDKKFEGPETFKLKLSDPVMTILEYPDVATVTILDAEDESTVYFPANEYHVTEDIGEILIPVHRSGDISSELMMICFTQQDSATGTVPNTVTSFSDYITRTEDHRSIIRFDKGESDKMCRVMIIDDSLFEKEEKFTVILSQPMGGRLGNFSKTVVSIIPDAKDEPAFYFGDADYAVDESDGFVEIKVWRTGTDLTKPSSVTVRTRKMIPVSAEAGLDYVGVNSILNFAPGVTMQTVKITILDDLGRPRLEGAESFQVKLRMPTGAVLGEPNIATILINDSQSDVPKVQFRDAEYIVFENDDHVTAFITRGGDISHLSTVRCYTRQSSAAVMEDYNERPDTDASIVTFLPGDREKPCTVSIMGDSLFEDTEEFRLVLGSPDSPSAGGAVIGLRNTTSIKIKDIGDSPIIKFDSSKYSVKEPQFPEDIGVAKVTVIRLGDLSKVSIVRVHTKDGSAKAGKDYNGISKELVFDKNVSRHIVEIDILYDGKKEMREAFTVHLKPDRNMIAEVKRNSKAIVYIEEMNKLADVTFPTRPMVVSLRDYDTAELADLHPVHGYPVICITPCNPKHPEFSKTGALCDSEGINDTLTRFHWMVSAPSGLDGVANDLRDVESDTYFASTRGITLDSIYFGGGSRIRCGARAVNVNGDPGLELLSPIRSISTEQGLCEPRVMDSVGAEPFTAKLRYTGADDLDHPNKVRVSVTIPHRDGMLPTISTRSLSNFELILSADGTRVGQHRCSNLLDYFEVPTQYGFITNATKNPNIIGEVEPYQYSAELRGEPTLRFYRNLNLEACLWEFVAYFNMTELISICGGTIETDGQVRNLKQSYVSMTVPLYVSYIFHSPVATGGWQNYDMKSQLRLTFVYDTAILWEKGISSLEGSGLQGYLYPTSMRIRDDGRLSVNFRTEARFRGLFVADHEGTDLTAMVMSSEHPDLTFTLQPIRSEPTYEQPEQTWEFVSDLAVRDYSGTYIVKIIPCTTSLDQEYSLPVVCNPREPITFDLPIRFQQVSDPVATEYSLNTIFHLVRTRELWLSDGSLGFGDESDSVFVPGDEILGRINIDPVQSLGESFHLNIEKVFICSGTDGYIPKYDPANQEYGCVAESPSLQYTFKILDKGAPHTCAEDFRDVKFNAQLAADDEFAVDLVQQSGADGFSMDSQPLFQVDPGRQWFIHAIYTVRSKENSQRGIGKRSLEYHALSLYSRHKRAVDDLDGVGQSDRGTNMARVSLDFVSKQSEKDPSSFDVGTNRETSTIPLLPILIAISILLVLSLIIAIIIIKRKKKSPPPSPTNTVTIVANGKSRVISTKHANNDPDNTEV